MKRRVYATTIHRLNIINQRVPAYLIIVSLFLMNCEGRQEKYARSDKWGKTVDIRYENGQYQLYRHGAPYFINGAGGYRFFDKLKENGGNSIRIWNTKDAGRILDEAHQLGLTVTLGLEVAHPRYGFNYLDEKAVAKQLDELKNIVIKYRDHPALLMWGVGNELNYFSSKFDLTEVRHILANIRLWQAVNEIAKMIHKEDPNHPTTTMIAGHSRLIRFINKVCPEIDILSVNTFGALPGLAEFIHDSGWDGPYVVSEWGPTGFWEAPRTAWDAPIEETSTVKGQLLLERYQSSIGRDTANCIGSYLFIWDVKQERTHTWFSMLVEPDYVMSMGDAMHYLWTGKWPEVPGPVVEPATINGLKGSENARLSSNSTNTAAITVINPADSLKYSWEILPELRGIELSEGGDIERKPLSVEGLFVSPTNQPEIVFKAPEKDGAYRLFVYVQDLQNRVATANIPFYVLP